MCANWGNGRVVHLGSLADFKVKRPYGWQLRGIGEHQQLAYSVEKLPFLMSYREFACLRCVFFLRAPPGLPVSRSVGLKRPNDRAREMQMVRST